MAQTARYKQMERYMTYALVADAALFILFLIFSGMGILWLKVITAVLCGLLSCACLAFLYMTKELLRQRSLWMSASAAACLICLLVSLLLNFPRPNPYKNTPADSEQTSAAISAQLL